MNVRKPIDYSTMMAENLPQVELYWEIGKLVSARRTKGSAVAASEYLISTYPGVSGFSPRNLRRTREFYRAYESAPEVLAQAMAIGWTKAELLKRIAAGTHTELSLDAEAGMCYTAFENTKTECSEHDENPVRLPWENTGTIVGSLGMTWF